MERIGQSGQENSESAGNNTAEFTTTEIVTFLLAEFEKEYGVKLQGDYAALWRLMEAADEARQNLSLEKTVKVNLPHMHRDKHLEVFVSHDKLMSRRG